VFGYAYPETQYWNFASDEEWRNNVRGIIQSLYPNSARSTLANAVATGNTLAQVVDADSFTDWMIQIKASPTEMPATFRAMFSLVGDFLSDPSTEIGIWTRMIVDGSESGAWKPRQVERKAKPLRTTDQGLASVIGLTSSLLEQITAGKLESLDPEAVLPYLEAHLTWNVYGVGQLEYIAIT
jgi:tyrosinase